MSKTLSNFIFIIALSLVIVNCANRGTPSGGEIDKTPPVIVKSIPENYSTNFSAKEIRIYFDEYVKTKNLQQQLIISPPMKSQPEITPLGSASKYINIKIYDTLLPNTTYAFNFGNSIVDNNEENPYPYYRYVFSTGENIDSLTVSGNIMDNLEREADDFVSIMLYEVDSTFTDSIIFNEVPKYITNTLDSTTAYTIENIKAGKFLLLALKDENSDNKFQPKSDKIAFHKSFITIPTDSIYNLKLFKEVLDFKIIKPRLISGEKIAFGYQGNYENTQINIQSNVPNNFTYRIAKDAETDSLNYWYKPRMEVDSLLFNVKNKNYSEDFTVKISVQERDTLVVKSNPVGTIHFNDQFKISGNVPFTAIDTTKIKLIDKDSVAIDYSVKLDSINNTYVFDFKKTESNTYRFSAIPNAFKDFFEDTNDTLNYTIRTKTFNDYGNVRITLKNATYPVIVQLTDDKGDVKEEKYSAKPELLDFKNINPNKYYLRVIYDTNKNGKYDSGNYLKKQSPERVSYFPELLDVRAGWDLIEDFTLN